MIQAGAKGGYPFKVQNIGLISLSIDVHLLNFILMTETLKLSLLLSGNYLSEKLYGIGILKETIINRALVFFNTVNQYNLY